METPAQADERTFRAAVDWAVSQLQHARKIAPELLLPDGREKIDDVDAGLQALLTDGSMILARAETDWRAYRALELGCARYLRNSQSLPAWANRWLIDKLERRNQPPARPRGALSKGGLHQVICECIDELVNVGMVGVRNDATLQRSACDVLAAALKDLGLQPSTFEGVKRIYIGWVKEQDKREQELARRAKAADH